MTEERPDDAHEPDETAAPAAGDDGLEARRASASDAPFHGLRSAADIFGAPRGADEWPSRRERREAEKTARETGAPLPEPFDPVESVTSPPEGHGDARTDDDARVDDDLATQAISMPEELTAPSQNPQASIEHERSTLGDRIPPAAPVPPTSTAPHPSSIALPFAQAHRDERALDNRAVEDERRRLDPFGEGRDDVDWLGRATGPRATPDASGAPVLPPPPPGSGLPAVPQPLGVENVLPSAAVRPDFSEPPSFTELLRIAGDADGASAAAGPDRPFDWALRDDDANEVPATLTTDAFDTTALAGGSWHLADDSDDDDVVAGEVTTPVAGTPVVPAAPPVPPAVPAAVPPAVPAAVPAAPIVPPAAGSDETAPVPSPDRADVVDASDEADDEPRLQADDATAALPVQGDQPETAWWAEPDATVPPTAAPPLVEPPLGDSHTQASPAQLPPAVGRDLDAVAGIRTDHAVDHHDEPAALAPGAPEDLDQSEWHGRETSDTSAIKDLFGTEAVGQLGGTGYDPHDTGTAMMPAVGRPGDAAPVAGRTPSAPTSTTVPRSASGPGAGASTAAAAAGGGGRDNFINEGFAKLRNEGQRGKRLLIWGSIALIVVLLVAVFALTRWILGNTIEEHTPAPSATSTSAASSPASATATPATAASAPAAAATSAATLQFATTPAAPGQHAWTELAGGECLSPFTNAWAQTFTVVDCSAPHVAQLTARLPVTGGQWPGTAALAQQAGEQCQTSKALNTAAAAAYGDVQVQGSYAPDQATWDQGETFISCFATRSSGGTLTGSLAPGA